MARKTKNEYLAEVRELIDVAENYPSLPAGPARNMMHMVYFGLLALERDLAAGESNRAKVARHKAKVRGGAVCGDVPLFPAP